MSVRGFSGQEEGALLEDERHRQPHQQQDDNARDRCFELENVPGFE
jgi:hypothetical protein